jgi:hypothetical protein
MFSLDAQSRQYHFLEPRPLFLAILLKTESPTLNFLPQLQHFPLNRPLRFKLETSGFVSLNTILEAIATPLN